METAKVLRSSHRLFANLSRQTSDFRHCGVLKTQKVGYRWEKKKGKMERWG